MADTSLLQLPLIAGGQSQKHVTHNEGLKVLDAVVQLSVKSRMLTAPPGAPADSDRYIVGPSATGAWSGQDGRIAIFVDGAWEFHVPRTGWVCFVEGEGLVNHVGGTWSAFLALSAHGAGMGMRVIEEEVTLSGASTDTSIFIPNRAIVFAVSVRTTLAITGATSFSCGVAGETAKFGGSLGVALGATNIGVIGPTAYYADTPIRLTSAGGSFSGGKVRVAIQCMTFSAPTS